MPLATRPTFWFCTLPAIALYAPLAYATHYLDVSEAQKLMFPQAESFSEVSTSTNHSLKIWRVSKSSELLGYFFVDDVIGKHEFITYALAISSTGYIKQIEILDYRETKGGQITDSAWREQFKDKSFKDALEVGSDITNISGATLSCKHVTEGVRRVLALYESQLRSPA